MKSLHIAVLITTIAVGLYFGLHNYTFISTVSNYIDSLDSNKGLDKNRFLLTNFAPVDREISNFQLEVKFGEIPKDLSGLFIRNGPNPIHHKRRYHWFDGHGMIHSGNFIYWHAVLKIYSLYNYNLYYTL